MQLHSPLTLKFTDTNNYLHSLKQNLRFNNHHEYTTRLPSSPKYSKRSVKTNSPSIRIEVAWQKEREERRSRAYARTTPRHEQQGSISVARCCKDRIDASLHRVAVLRCAPLHASRQIRARCTCTLVDQLLSDRLQTCAHLSHTLCQTVSTPWQN